jgi:hypothetical protein
MRPNAPRMITVVVAVILMAIGLALVVLPGGQIADLIRSIADLGLPSGIENDLLRLAAERLIAWGFLAAAPLLLVVGSLVKGL